MIKLKVGETSLLFGARKVERKKNSVKDLTDKLTSLEKTSENTFSNSGNNEEIEYKLCKVREEQEKIQQYKTKKSILRSKARWYNEGEKNSKYFCQLEKRHFQNKSINQLQKPDGSKLTTTLAAVSVSF